MNSTDVLPCFESPSDAPTRRNSHRRQTEKAQSEPEQQPRLKKGKKTSTDSPNKQNVIHPDELQFVAMLLRREANAWQEFLARYEKLIITRVLSTCREFGVVPHPELVEDCSAEVLAVLFHRDMDGLRQFRGRSKLSTWLAVIARRATIAFLKRQKQQTEKRRPNDSHFDIASIADSPDKGSSGIDPEIQQRLQRSLDQLKKSDRLALTLHFDQKLSYAQIGRELGISENAVGPKLHRAQKRLKKLMEAGTQNK